MASKHRQTTRFLATLRNMLDQLQDVLVEASDASAMTNSGKIKPVVGDAASGAPGAGGGGAPLPRSVGRQLELGKC